MQLTYPQARLTRSSRPARSFLARIFEFQRPLVEAGPVGAAVAESPEATQGGGSEVAETPRMEVWIEPISEHAKAQTLLRGRKIEKDVFLIGRRGALSANYRPADVDYLVSEHEPYLVSKRQCAIEVGGDSVVVRDLGSHNGTLVDGLRLRGNSSRPDAVALEPGEHTLELGSRESPFQFRLWIGAAA